MSREQRGLIEDVLVNLILVMMAYALCVRWPVMAEMQHGPLRWLAVGGCLVLAGLWLVQFVALCVYCWLVWRERASR